MNSTTITRNKIIEAIEGLSEESLPELASFIDYLHYKARKAESSLGQHDEGSIDESDTWTEEDQLDLVNFSWQYAATTLYESEEATNDL
ncbi:hypothetical protein [Roseofilum capinflatum]|jgi:hypothetical protein|uniref:DUF2281 domain-containing protein n=1 Tax=Roseofilum capinflatum BLCC-M114 TaxID=3022440 RepID=A0ABT7BDI8_9CYAN|nr:hypothetical protein [Roseofilum capinflatum]MDJ1177235.1 hypothetical protein [Roseofilum capinflatum BLCC-M114]